MKKPINLNEEQIQGLQDLSKTAAHPSVRRRAQAILLLHQGPTIGQVAQRLGVWPEAVSRWLRRYQAEGLAGLLDRPRSGRPPKVNADFQRTLIAFLPGSPRLLTDARTERWTVPLLRETMELYTGIALSDGRMRAWLHRLGYAYRPKVFSAFGNPPPLPKRFTRKTWRELARAWINQGPDAEYTAWTWTTRDP